MNPAESWSNSPIATDTDANEAAVEKRDAKEISENIQQILSFRMEMKDLDDPEPVLDGLFDSLVADVEELSVQYGVTNPEVVDKQERENNALKALGFGDVPAVLDRIQEVKRMIVLDIPGMVKDKVSDVITPPDAGAEIHAGDGSGFDKERTLIPRLKMLLFILLNDCHKEKDSVHITEGSVTEEMVRQEPYVAVEIPELQRLVLVCDEEGNRTDVFDTSNPACMEEGKAGILLLTKDEKNKFGEMYPGAHQTLKYSDTWPDRVYGALTETLPKPAEVPQKVERPASFEVMPQIDSVTGFHTDVEGASWGSARQIMLSLGVEELRKKPEVVNQIEGLPSRKMRWGIKPIDAYNLADVNKLFLEDEELSGYLRKTNDQGFYPDTDGTLLGSQHMIASHLGSTNLLQKPEFTAIFTGCPHKKILSKTKLVDGYDLNHVRAAMEGSETLSPYLRKVDEFGFYTDPQGVKYASVRKVCLALCGGDEMAADRLRTKLEFKDILRRAQTMRILSKSNVVTGYAVDEITDRVMRDEKLKAVVVTK